MEKEYIEKEITYNANSIRNIDLINIDGLLLKIEFSRTSKITLETITNVSQRRAEKILFQLQNSKKPIVEVIEESEVKRIC